ncbi:hypothetical protein ACOXXX_02235 [Thalassococcus sp. BH17M4-6]|uniref:hypothetical protein n=1 Tax=Thalassococcus sp. BH17M4-6 TaxID=3413148 RepID=UPI003BEA9128
MRLVALILAIAPLPALGDVLDCTLQAEDAAVESRLRFEIDRRQFAPATSPNEPPRQVRSYVTQDGVRYVAEPFLMQGGVRGFWAENRQGGSALLVIEADGAAKMTDQALGLALTGTCEDVE